MSIFTFQPEDYIRHTNLLEDYIQDNALYTSRMLNKPQDQCETFIRRNMQPDGLAPLRDPAVRFLQRQTNGDRKDVKDKTFSAYINHVHEKKLIMAPTMTVYMNKNQRPSLLAEYIEANLKLRKGFKHKMFTASMAKDKVKESYYNCLQNTSKIKNNSLSGAHASPSTILFNKSSHSSLTSTCRISTSYANANNEWLLAGNRHLWCYQVTLTSLIVACRHTDFVALQRAMDLYNIYIPNVEDVLACIKRSTSLYWRSTEAFEEITQFVSAMTDIERAAFVYTCDLYHLAKHNPELVRQFLGDLAQQAPSPIPDPEVWMRKLDSDQYAMVSLLCSDILAGRPVDDVDSGIKQHDPTAYALLGATAKQLIERVESYTPLIHGIFRPTVLPPSIAVLPSIIRRVVVTSDTDSTIFTNQYWTDWFTDGDTFSVKAYQIGYTTTYLASQTVRHKLALMSANIGILQEHIHKISMKNEYYFPVFSLTPVAKHYYGLKSAQEGNVFDVAKTEIKGVHLRDSSAPPAVTAMLKEYIEHTMAIVVSGKLLTADEVLGPVAALEISILNDIKSGGWRYMKSAQIKDKNSYVQADDAAIYKQYLTWNEVFGPKYGDAPEPPYQAVKVAVDLESAPKIKAWISSIPDREVADRLLQWVRDGNKTSITNFVLPAPILEAIGIPDEIRQAINLRKLVLNIVKPFYLVLSSFGIYMLNDKMTRLVSDDYTPKRTYPEYSMLQ